MCKATLASSPHWICQDTTLILRLAGQHPKAENSWPKPPYPPSRWLFTLIQIDIRAVFGLAGTSCGVVGAKCSSRALSRGELRGAGSIAAKMLYLTPQCFIPILALYSGA